jgi:hypothetical protein
MVLASSTPLWFIALAIVVFAIVAGLRATGRFRGRDGRGGGGMIP